MPASSQYRSTELSSLNNGLDTVEALIDSVADVSDGLSGSIELELKDGIFDVIGLTGEDAEDYIGDVRKGELEFELGSKGELSGAKMKLKLEKTEIGEAEFIIDREMATVYQSYPGLADEYVETQLDGGSFNALMSAGGFSKLSILPDGKDVAKLAERLIKEGIAEIKDVEKEKTTARVGSVKQKCTVYTVEFDEDTLTDVMTAVLEAAQKDKELKKIAYRFLVALENISGVYLEYTEDELYDAIDSGIDEILSDMDFEGAEFTYKLYVDSGEVIGREIYAYGEVLSLMSAKDGRDYAFEYSVGSKILLEGDGKKSGDKFSGDVRMSVNGSEIVKLELENYEYDAKNLTASGKVTIGFGGALTQILRNEMATMLRRLEVEIDLDKKKDSAEIEAVLRSGSTELGEITLNVKNKSSYSPKIPSDISAEDYIDIDFDKLADRLSKAGLPDEVCDNIVGF